MNAFSAVGSLLQLLILAACSYATSSIDPRTQPPVVRAETVTNSMQAERAFRTTASNVTVVLTNPYTLGDPS